LLPHLIEAWDRTALSDKLRAKYSPHIAALRRWDFHWGAASVPTTLAIYWGERAVRAATVPALALHMSAQTYVATRAEPSLLIGALAQASDTLTQVFGTWKVPWGEINRFQRLDDRIDPHFDDAQPSQAVPFTSGIWGSLASFGARPYPDTK